MVGGKVVEVCDVPEMPERLFVDVADMPYGKVERCAIYVEKSEQSQRIQIGDSIWWQGRNAYWTPQCGTQGEDIPIPRIGYSGVKHPRDWRPEDLAEFRAERAKAQQKGAADG
jgi:hypothetical protein